VFIGLGIEGTGLLLHNGKFVNHCRQVCLRLIFDDTVSIQTVHTYIYSCRGAMLQAGRSRVRFPMR
jgi:hypothetical protein